MSVANLKYDILLPPTCITEHLVLYDDLVSVQSLRVHVIVGVLSCQVKQDLEKKKIYKLKSHLTNIDLKR